MTDAGPSGRAFEELLGEHLDALYATALRLAGGREADAEDLLQEAALRAFRAFRQLRDPGAGRTWLFTRRSSRTRSELVREYGRTGSR